MTRFFDEAKWDEALQYDDWYLRIWEELKPLMKRVGDEGEGLEIKNQLRAYFVDRMRREMIPFRDHGFNLDEQRKPIDAVIIHHTSNPKPYSVELMNVVQMLNLYVTYFVDPRDDRERSLKGRALWSSHVRDGKPVFWAYHWLVRRDGAVERLLEDHELGWHAGSWDVNCRSVAICLDNDYENSEPSESELQSIAKLIKGNYSAVTPGKILGHNEVNQKTVCPGNLFLSSWKYKLLGKL